MQTESGILQSPALPSPGYLPQRQHLRAPISGQVPLYLTRSVFIPAELLDVSVAGFRVRHHSAGITPGTVLHAWGFVSARVVWTRSSDDITESGCELLD